MADVRISDLTPAGAALATQIMEVTDSGASKSITLALLKAFISASTTLTGTPTVPNVTAGDNSTKAANTAFVAAAIAALINSSPAVLDTLKELADAIGDDPNYATTISAALANRVRVDADQGLSAAQQVIARQNIRTLSRGRIVAAAN